MNENCFYPRKMHKKANKLGNISESTHLYKILDYIQKNS